MKESIKTDKFNTGSYALPRTAEPVDKYTMRSKMKNGGGQNDALRAALGHRTPTLPSGQMNWSHGKKPTPRGATYRPDGAFGRVSPSGAGKGVYSYGKNKFSAKPSNAVGNPDGGRGGNAVGNPSGRRGANAVGYAPNRRGSNAVGNPPNRSGQNALGR